MTDEDRDDTRSEALLRDIRYCVVMLVLLAMVHMLIMGISGVVGVRINKKQVDEIVKTIQDAKALETKAIQK